ncbi:GDSL-type esterase/lipase family protein [Pluralibacter gergoviae]
MNINDKPAWSDSVKMISRGEKVEGGRGGVANIQAQQLADRTAFLKLRIDSFDDAKDRTFFITDSDPDGTIAGLSQTTPGQIFRVAQGVNSDLVFIYYANINGAAVAIGGAISDKFIKNRLPDVYPSPRKVPLCADRNDNVSAWFEDGEFNAMALHNNLRDIRDVPHPKKIAMCHDINGSVAVWIEDGKLNAMALHDNLLKDLLTLREFESRMQSRMTISAGNTLWKYRAKKAKLELGQNAKISIGFSGDSWTEHDTIPQAFADYLYQKYGKAGNGWIQLNIDNPNQLNGITLQRAGWSVYDASATSAAPQFPTAMDGQYIYATGTAATLSVSKLSDAALRVFYYDGNGTFRYSVNGAAPVTIAGAGTNKIISASIPLNDAVQNTVNIDLTGNTGTVVIYGFHSTGPDTGIEINKMGNGGIMAEQYIKTLPYLAQTAATVNPDVLVLVIGTNDFRQSASLQGFRDGLTWWVQAWQAVAPDAAIILVMPAQCNASGTNPLSAFRDIMRDVSEKLGVEYFSLYDHMTTSYAKANTAGLWRDNLHLSDLGARVLLNHLINFLE